MGNWLVPCADCGERIRFVLRPGNRFHRYEDADSGQAHECPAKPPAPSVVWLPCACGAIVQHVGGLAARMNADCTLHLCAATTTKPAEKTERPRVVTVTRPVTRPVATPESNPKVPAGAIAL